MEALSLPPMDDLPMQQQLILLSAFNNVPLPSTLIALGISDQEFASLRKENPEFDQSYRAILLYNLNAHHSTLKNSASLGDVKSITTLLDRDEKKSSTTQTDFLARALLEAQSIT